MKQMIIVRSHSLWVGYDEFLILKQMNPMGLVWFLRLTFFYICFSCILYKFRTNTQINKHTENKHIYIYIYIYYIELWNLIVHKKIHMNVVGLNMDYKHFLTYIARAFREAFVIYHQNQTNLLLFFVLILYFLTFGDTLSEILLILNLHV